MEKHDNEKEVRKKVSHLKLPGRWWPGHCRRCCWQHKCGGQHRRGVLQETTNSPELVVSAPRGPRPVSRSDPSGTTCGTTGNQWGASLSETQNHAVWNTSIRSYPTAFPWDTLLSLGFLNDSQRRLAFIAKGEGSSSPMWTRTRIQPKNLTELPQAKPLYLSREFSWLHVFAMFRTKIQHGKKNILLRQQN